MLLSKDMSRGEALKVMLQSERRQIAFSLGSAVMCSLVEVVPWVCLFLSLEAMASGESQFYICLYSLLHCCGVTGCTLLRFGWRI